MVLTMDRWKGKVAVVTGASSGIGAAIVEQLVDQGLKVVGLARRKEKLDELTKIHENKKGKFFGVVTDITKEEDIISAFQWIKDNLEPVHILVNCAGISRITGLVDGDTNMWKDVFNTNLLGLCTATREAVRNMRANNVDGHIIHINSLLGHKLLNAPKLNVYPASKFGVTALTETLKLELIQMKSKIKVSSISPGLVKTELHHATAIGSGANQIAKSFEEFLKTAPILEASDVADAVTYVLSTPPHVQVPELFIQPVGEAF